MKNSPNSQELLLICCSIVLNMGAGDTNECFVQRKIFEMDSHLNELTRDTTKFQNVKETKKLWQHLRDVRGGSWKDERVNLKGFK